jgi:predicted N-acetyltransferase YhbS
MTEQLIEVREFLAADEPGVAALLAAHMQSDQTWPPRYARESGALSQWLAASARLGRWVATQGDAVIGHVGVSPVQPGEKAGLWQAAVGCPLERLAEIGRLVVHPARRRAGVSELLTRRCVRGTVSAGHVPVATALLTATASIAMMTGLGWRVIGDVIGRRSGQAILLLVAPAQLVEAALSASNPPTR